MRSPVIPEVVIAERVDLSGEQMGMALADPDIERVIRVTSSFLGAIIFP